MTKVLFLSGILSVLSGCLVSTQPATAQTTPVQAFAAPPPPQTVVVAQPIQPPAPVVVQGPQVPTATFVQSDASNFGTLRVQPGFLPDPATASGTSGGALNAQNMGGGCRGWIANRPDHVAYLDGPFSYLRIEATSGQDTTLVVRGPAGVRCDDDSGGSRNPRLEGFWPAGRYEVWVGSYNEGAYAPYSLNLSEIQSGGTVSAMTVPVSTVLSSSLQSNFGTVALASGFLPDPYVASGTSGGAVHASGIAGSCVGWIANRPDHIMILNTSFNYLRIEGISAQDTTVVVRGPVGVYCDDDSGGDRNPLVEGFWPAGSYEIWVGSYNQGTYAPYSLRFTELRR